MSMRDLALSFFSPVHHGNISNIEYIPLDIRYPYLWGNELEFFIKIFKTPLIDYIPKNESSKKDEDNIQARIVRLSSKGLTDEEEKPIFRFLFELIEAMPVFDLPHLFTTNIKKNSPELTLFRTSLISIADYKLQIVFENRSKGIMNPDFTINLKDSFDIMKYTFTNKNDKNKSVISEVLFYDKVNEKYIKVKDVYY